MHKTDEKIKEILLKTAKFDFREKGKIQTNSEVLQGAEGLPEGGKPATKMLKKVQAKEKFPGK